jgi:hypothetical protein
MIPSAAPSTSNYERDTVLGCFRSVKGSSYILNLFACGPDVHRKRRPGAVATNH